MVCGALVVIIRSAPTPPAYASLDASLDSPLRRQIIGDSAVIEKGVRTGWSDVFDLEGDRFLASFAIPGVSASVRSTTEENLLKALSTPHSASCTDAEGIESRQIRAIVAGMKRELRAYLAAGGTLASYGKRLVNRQEAEIGYYNRVKMELETASKSGIDEQRLLPLWEKKNNELRNLGVKLVPLPE